MTQNKLNNIAFELYTTIKELLFKLDNKFSIPFRARIDRLIELSLVDIEKGYVLGGIDYYVNAFNTPTWSARIHKPITCDEVAIVESITVIIPADTLLDDIAFDKYIEEQQFEKYTNSGETDANNSKE